jgi:hypothetical protein
VHLKPNNGSPENQLPYTPFGLELYKAHKALEGADAVRPAEGNDPRNLCEPLGMPRTNHYNLNVTQFFQEVGMRVMSVPQNMRSGPKAS